MPENQPIQSRQFKKLLKECLIPLAQEGAPLILFDAPPRSSTQLDIRFEESEPLPLQRKKSIYPQISISTKEQVNSVSVPVIGCIFEGEAEYDVRHLLGTKGGRWIVPVKAGTLFFISPNIPFTSDKIAWESSLPEKAHARGVLMHLRHDGVRCQTFSMDKGKLWPHPYLFLYQPDALALGEKLLEEMQQMDSSVHTIAYYYWLLILHLLVRCIEQGRFATTRVNSFNPDNDEHSFSTTFSSEKRVALAEEYIQNHLGETNLNHTKIADHCGLSSRQLERLFQSEKQISLSQYIQHHRLVKSCELLQSSYISIGEVAGYCGFKRLSNFSNWFAQQKGCSPSAYRKKRKEKSNLA